MHNGIPIKEFHGDVKDDVLQSLCKYLLSYEQCKDVRQKISNDFNFASLVSKRYATELSNLSAILQ